MREGSIGTEQRREITEPDFKTVGDQCRSENGRTSKDQAGRAGVRCFQGARRQWGVHREGCFPTLIIGRCMSELHQCRGLNSMPITFTGDCAGGTRKWAAHQQVRISESKLVIRAEEVTECQIFTKLFSRLALEVAIDVRHDFGGKDKLVDLDMPVISVSLQFRRMPYHTFNRCTRLQ